jgi:hypothetical protein
LRHVRRTPRLIADVQLPGTTGFGLYQRLSASGKPIPTILIDRSRRLVKPAWRQGLADRLRPDLREYSLQHLNPRRERVVIGFDGAFQEVDEGDFLFFG